MHPRRRRRDLQPDVESLALTYQQGLDAQVELDEADDLLGDDERGELRRAIVEGEVALGRFITNHVASLTAEARALRAHPHEVDDLVAAGMSEIARALGTWCPGGGANPRTWCMRLIRHRMIDTLRVIRRQLRWQPPGVQFTDMGVQPDRPTARPLDDPAIALENSATLDQLRELHGRIRCCEVGPTAERPACCRRMLRALRATASRSLVRGLKGP